MKLKNLKILGVFLAFLLAFPIHFAYEKFPSFLTSIIFPVNESVFEHMKIIFGAILLSGIIQKLIVIYKKLPFNNICISNVITAIISIPIFLVFFYPVYYIIGENLFLTIFIMFITFIISQLITTYIIKLKNLKLENFAIIIVIIIYIIFGYFTYNPPKTEFFRDPIGNYYGIKKS